MAKKRKMTRKSTTSGATSNEVSEGDHPDLLVDVVKTRTPDRVSVSIGSKIPGPKPYTTHDVNVSLESNVRDGEKSEDALDRVQDLALKHFNDAIDETLKILDNVILDRPSQGARR